MNQQTIMIQTSVRMETLKPRTLEISGFATTNCVAAWVWHFWRSRVTRPLPKSMRASVDDLRYQYRPSKSAVHRLVCPFRRSDRSSHSTDSSSALAESRPRANPGARYPEHPEVPYEPPSPLSQTLVSPDGILATASTRRPTHTHPRM